MSKNRLAHCACSKTKIEVRDNPDVVAVCSCLECQRRTGSVIGVSSYFRKEAIISQTGETLKFTRVSEGGEDIDTFFCQNCGTTVWWDAPFLPEHVGIAVGCFGDPDFPQPLVSVWERTKHRWLKFSWLALPFKKQTPSWFNTVALTFSLPKLTHSILSIFSSSRKSANSLEQEECALKKVKAVLVNKEASV